jgi:hypothetical protein
MKKIAYLFIALTFMMVTSCGGDATTDESTENTENTVELKDFEELNLEEYGFNLIVMVPKAELSGEPQVVLTERGALEVIVGSDFGLEIQFGEGDLELLKTDLKEDLVFTSEIILEEENALIYSQDIPDSGVKTQNHFLYKAVIGSETYEVRDLMDGEYGTGMIERMLSAAKTLKSSNTKVTA